ncbi:PucR family transcriptional regulator [Agromyces sp. NPDC057865]|uniref:PucR family transcriptional regulator n=1 Tax=Agromyces sp. NPDC057865 TaxID=3346267 RepID=UPI00366E03FF
MTLQQTITRIAGELERPALLEDRRRRVVAHSPHPDGIDDVRRRSILEHRANPAIHGWLTALGVYDATDPVRVPGNPELGMVARVCVPIIRSGVVFGHLWFIEPDDGTPPLDLRRAGASAVEVADEWASARSSQDHQGARERELVRDLVLGRAEVRRRAADALMESGRFEGGRLRTYVLERVTGGGTSDAELDRAARRARRALGGRGVLVVARGDHAALVAPASGRFADSDRIAAMIASSAVEALAGPDAPDDVVRVGVGGEAPVASARASYREARRALGVARSFGLIDPVVHWDRLGVYRGLDAAAARGLRSGDVQPGLDRVAAERDGQVLLETIECYLDAAGHVQQAAARLQVHRTSLYNRIARVERILGIDLGSGLDRLALHLALLLRAGEAASPRPFG